MHARLHRLVENEKITHMTFTSAVELTEREAPDEIRYGNDRFSLELADDRINSNGETIYEYIYSRNT